MAGAAATGAEPAGPEKVAAVPPKARKHKEKKKRVPRSQRGGLHDDIARAPAPNPTWFVPVMCGLMIIGLFWVVIYYLSAGQWPVRAMGNWNLLAGFAFIISGFMMTTRWR
nr:cell division protein CrgA [Kineosphaera limosa]